MKNMNNVETALRVLVAAGTAATLTTCNPAPRPTVFFEGGTVTPEPTKPPRPTEIPTAVMTSTPDYGTVMTSTLPETQTTGIYIEMAQFVATGNQGNDEIMSTIPVTALVKMKEAITARFPGQDVFYYQTPDNADGSGSGTFNPETGIGQVSMAPESLVIDGSMYEFGGVQSEKGLEYNSIGADGSVAKKGYLPNNFTWNEEGDKPVAVTWVRDGNGKDFYVAIVDRANEVHIGDVPHTFVPDMPVVATAPVIPTMGVTVTQEAVKATPAIAKPTDSVSVTVGATDTLPTRAVTTSLGGGVKLTDSLPLSPTASAPKIEPAATVTATTAESDADVIAFVDKMSPIDVSKNPEEVAKLTTKQAVEAWLKGKIVGYQDMGVVIGQNAGFPDGKVHFGKMYVHAIGSGNATYDDGTIPSIILGVENNVMYLGFQTPKSTAVLPISLDHSSNFGYYDGQPDVRTVSSHFYNDNRDGLVDKAKNDRGKLSIVHTPLNLNGAFSLAEAMKWPGATTVDTSAADKIGKDHSLSSDQVANIKFILIYEAVRDGGKVLSEKELLDSSSTNAINYNRMAEFNSFITGNSNIAPETVITTSSNLNTVVDTNFSFAIPQ